MKKMLHLCISGILRHLFMSVLIILQILVLLLGMNALLASYNQQYILVAPYSEILDKDGYYLSSCEAEEEGEASLIDSLKGKWERTSIKRYFFTYDDGNTELNAHIIILSDKFWDSYTPSIKKGKWFKSNEEKDSPWCVATPNYMEETLDITGGSSSIKVRGTLGDKCYIPSMDTWSAAGSLADNLYTRFNIEQTDHVYILMPQCQWDKLGVSEKLVSSDSNCIITPVSELSEQDKVENEKLFQQYCSPEIKLSVLKERAYEDVNKNTRRFLPLIIAQLVITVFGMVCATAIWALQDRNTMAIYTLCGMSKRQSIFIAAGKAALIVGMSSLWLVIAYFITGSKGVYAEYGLLFRQNNIYATLAVILLLIVGSVVTNLMVNMGSKPADNLRRRDQ